MPFIYCPWCSRKIHVQVRAYIEQHRGQEQFTLRDRLGHNDNREKEDRNYSRRRDSRREQE